MASGLVKSLQEEDLARVPSSVANSPPSASGASAASGDDDERASPGSSRGANNHNNNLNNGKQRRKQSRPVRIPATQLPDMVDEDEDMNQEDGEAPLNLSYSGTRASYYNKTEDDGMDGDARKEGTKMAAMEMASMTTPLAAASLSTTFPFSSHFLLPLFASSSTTAPSVLSTAPTLPTPVSPSPSSTSPAPPLRIFNLEAYCELCKREFCNKYFLKTHKANKHGIYSDVPCPPTATAATTPPTTTTTAVAVPEPTYQGTFLTSPASRRLTTTQDSINKRGTTDDPDAYCHLCQKKFCNKYFVKRHMAKMHGSSAPSSRTGAATSVTDESRTSSPLGNGDVVTIPISSSSPPTISSIAATVITSNANSTTATTTLLDGDLEISRVGESPEDARDASDATDAFCHICQKSLCNKYILEAHMRTMHGVAEDGEATSGASPLTCDECGRAYQSEYLLQMHRAYSHGDKDAKDAPDELQRLQSMLQQLSGMKKTSVTGDVPAVCSVCGKVVENKYFLRAHMINEHGLLTSEDEEASVASPAKAESSSPPASTQPATYCTPCRKDFFDAYFYQLHVQHIHGGEAMETDHDANDDTSTPTQMSNTPATDSPPAAVNSDSAQPTSSVTTSSGATSHCYCNICQKELCNKYFMKIHMQKMHGISLENASQVGGVTCDICRKTLCSKYFLKVHKQNVHHIPDDSPSRRGDSRNHAGGGDSSASSLSSLSQHRQRFSEMCPLCARWFKNVKALQNHLVAEHGEPGRNKWREVETQRQMTMPATTSVPMPSVSPPPCLCLWCGGAFRDRLALNLHVYTVHRALVDRLWSRTDTDVPTSNGANDDVIQQQQASLNLLSKVEASSPRLYRCSYCPFVTFHLVYSIAHERTHTGLAASTFPALPAPMSQPSPEVSQDATCDVIVTSVATSDVVTTTSVTADVTSASCEEGDKTNADTNPDETPEIPAVNYPQALSVPSSVIVKNKTKKRAKKKHHRRHIFRCPKCPRRFPSRHMALSHLHSKHAVSVAMRRGTISPYQKGWRRCSQCGWSSRSPVLLRRHVILMHRKKEASEAILPSDGHFVLQPFLLAEPPTPAPPSSPPRRQDDAHDVPGAPDACCHFAPSLVVLPVSHKVSKPLTATFTLTPAPREMLNDV